MPTKRNNASALLNKVNSQLRGERIPVKAKDEDELEMYLNNLTQKVQQNKSGNFQEYGDVSLSSGADAKNSGSLNDNNSSSPGVQIPTPASRFLKKKSALSASASTSFEGKKAEVSVKNKKKATLTADRKAPYQSRSSTEKTNAFTKTGKESGLNRLLSKDSESEGSIKGSDVGWRSSSADAAVRREGRKLVKSQRSLVENDQLNLRSSSSQSTKRILSQEKKSQQRNGGKHKDEIVRTLGSQFVPSDQDSLAEFIQGLSTSESSAKRPQNLVAKKQQKWRKKASSSVSHSPSPVQGSRSPSPLKRSKSPFGKLSRSVSQDTEMADSEILENRQGSDNSDDHFKINLMDVASLLPSSSPPQNRKTVQKHSKSKLDKPGKSSRPNLITSPAVKTKGKEKIKSPKMSSKKSESRSNLFDAFGIHMADELLDFNKGKDADMDISEESEIKTESSGRQRKTMQRQHYASGKATNIGERKTTFLEQSSPETSVSEAIPIRNFDDRRTRDMDMTDVEYSDSFDSESKTVTQSASLKSKDKKSKSQGHRSQHDSHRRRDHKVVMEEMLVDVSVADVKGSRAHWNTTHMDVRVSTPYGLQYVDPAPVATHVVSADALEALTAYSPNMLALQEMMQAQLQLVHNFMDIQRRIYQSCMDGLHYDYKYTTLEDTKEYISKNHKSRMTFKEALQHVEEEEATTT